MTNRQWPLPEGSYKITSRFAGRINPVTGKPENHSGTDFAAPDGTPFYAVATGTVLYIGAADGYGQWIVTDIPASEGGGCVEYGHMWNAFATGLKVGDRVERGQKIGYIGSNGQSTGPHLHITCWQYAYKGQRVDPETWLQGAPHVPVGGGKAEGKVPPVNSGGTLFGVDVSYFQNGMSLKRAASEGISFAIIRTTDGTFKDNCYRSHMEDAESSGLITAAYHFCRNPNEGTTIAQQVAASVSVMGDMVRPMWLDCETGAGLTAQHVREFKRRFEDAGVRVIGVYSYVPWWEGKVIGGEPDSHEFGKFWVASYGSDSVGTPSALYAGKSMSQWDYPLGNQRPSLWQFGSKGSVAGKLVDVNAFRGTKEQLRALFYGGTATSEEDDMTEEDRRLLREVHYQLLHKWPQLGGNTLVDTVALLLDFIAGPDKDFNGWPASEDWGGTDGKATLEYLSKMLETIAGAVVKNK